MRDGPKGGVERDGWEFHGGDVLSGIIDVVAWPCGAILVAKYP